MGFWALSCEHEGPKLWSFTLSLQPLIRSSLLHEWEVCFQTMRQNLSAKHRTLFVLQGSWLEAGARANFFFFKSGMTLRIFSDAGREQRDLIPITRAGWGERHSISLICRKGSPENQLCKRKAGSLTPRGHSRVFEKSLSVGRGDASSNTQV